MIPVCAKCKAVFFEPEHGSLCKDCLAKAFEVGLASPALRLSKFAAVPPVLELPRDQARRLLAEAEELLEEAVRLDPSNSKARGDLTQVRTLRTQLA